MGAIKRELERVAEIVIYGNAETIEREFRKVEELGGSLAILAQAVEMARYTAPLCDCGADYYTELHAKWAQQIEQINNPPAKIERILSNAEDGW
jgi:hypothetical protein